MNKELKCYNCDRTFTSGASLKYHTQNKVRQKDRQCRICKQIYRMEEHECKLCVLCYDKVNIEGHLLMCSVMQTEKYEHYLYDKDISLEQIKDLIIKRRKFLKIAPHFEIKENIPWTNQKHWNKICDRCGDKCNGAHIPLCLI